MKMTGNLSSTTKIEVTLREKLLIEMTRKLDNAGSNDIIKALAFGKSVTPKNQKKAVRKVGHRKIGTVRKLFYKKIK
tara:strand:+ start:134 stop:364 length:231 start_codon:yes stop_codon:yes gene_type:complete